MKFLANLASRMALIWVFAHFGWMTFQLDGQPIHGFGQHLLFAFIGGILLFVLGLVLIIPYALLGSVLAVLTLGLFLFVCDTVFFALLIWVISWIFPANLVLHGFWLTVLCALILSVVSGIIRWLFDDGND